MQKNQLSSEERELLCNLFWDVAVDSISIGRHTHFIIERIITLGNPEQVNWMLKKFTAEQLIAVLKSSKNLDRKGANFWAVHFGIPQEEVLCLNNQSILN
ncbi:MAG: hypothetical protein PHQ23_06245 [Candidatus Wallbacteria bacterium]|nr:hypothetical protein [Candidatus Wallbacteria bacterium]